MRRWLPLLALVLLLAAFRYAGIVIESWPPNFQPIPAFTFCAVAFLPKGQRLIGAGICLIVWALAYPLWNARMGYNWSSGLVMTLVGIAAVVGVAFFFRRAKSIWQKLVGISLGALAFYFVTNTFCFFSMPVYSKTLSGFIQAQWTGAPEHLQPTWVFLRNLIGGSILFGSFFFVANTVATPEEEKEEIEVEAESAT